MNGEVLRAKHAARAAGRAATSVARNLIIDRKEKIAKSGECWSSRAWKVLRLVRVAVRAGLGELAKALSAP